MKAEPESSKKSRISLAYGLSILSGALLSIILVLEMLDVLSSLGLQVFQELSISSPMKNFISLYMFMGFSGATLAFLGAYLLWKEYHKISVISNSAGAILALSTLTIPPLYGFTPPTVLTVGTLISALLAAISAASSLTHPAMAKPRAPLLSTVEIANVAVFSAMYAVAILLVIIPSPTGGYTHIGDIVVFMAALLFGYRVGGLVGIVGSVVADLYTMYPRWFVSILAHGLEGLVPGLAKGRTLMFQVVTCVIGGFLMATTYFLINIFIKGLPLAIISYARDLFIQAGISMIVAIIITNIIKRALPQFRQ